MMRSGQPGDAADFMALLLGSVVGLTPHHAFSCGEDSAAIVEKLEELGAHPFFAALFSTA